MLNSPEKTTLDLLFQPVKLGSQVLKNRIFLPALTRSRSTQPGDIPNEMMATYYAQRTQAGLMVTEGIVIEPRGRGFVATPGLYTPEQVEGWKKVVKAVHQHKGVIFAQLWHVGRVSHTSLQPGGLPPITPSALQANNVKTSVLSPEGNIVLATPSMPRALSTQEVEELVGLYRQAALNAKEAGFDGVELHAANGYLVNQFLSEHTNQRTDQYGGSVQNRLRFMIEVVEQLVDVLGKDKVGVRFSPLFTTTNQPRAYLGFVEKNPHEFYVTAIAALQKLGIAYVSLAEADWDDAEELPVSFREGIRKVFTGKVLCAGRYTAEKAAKAVGSGLVDMVGFGRLFIANPDLVSRIEHGYPYNKIDDDTKYFGHEKGYIDYPIYKE
ncbi:alkene reductase [Entomobacter blattae]|uniref:N-ethylmaleimide reductase n=1 Tax=Entomobacter blattae TaxID=2762277 RepID=A0A7H1NUC1_9PROT|nr:alkene reductase [Entomobacter blattae]QNT79381.1 N-ethylmaleimide reductase [Entomobacter blattae]